MSKEKFERKLISINYDRENDKIAKAKQSIVRINHILKQVEDLLPEYFNPDDRARLLADGYPFIMGRLKTKFQFPNATDKFNLESLGIDPLPLKNPLHSAVRLFSTDHLSIDNKGELYLSEEALGKIRVQASYFTQNEAQNKAFDKAKNICNVLNERLESIMDIAAYQPRHNALYEVTEKWDFLEVEKVEGSYMFVPSISRITRF